MTTTQSIEDAQGALHVAMVFEGPLHLVARAVPD
jgi:hypothetical protein